MPGCHPVLIVAGSDSAPVRYIDPVLRAMLASRYGVTPPWLLSLLSAFRWMSRDLLKNT